MLFRQRSGEVAPHRRIAIVRDVVEVVAIVLAGLWAIYVFIYTDRIEPYQKPSAPVVDAAIAVVGAKRNLLAVQLTESIRNTAPSTLTVLGTTAQVSGISVPNQASRYLATMNEPKVFEQSRVHGSRLEEAYAYAYRLPMQLNAGQDFVHRWIIYVPRARYDSLLFDAYWTYTQDSRVRATLSMERNRAGIIELRPVGPCSTTSGPSCPQNTGAEISISLWPPAAK
jgi:hypothetical protein